MVLFWSFIFPIFCLLRIIIHRKNLDDPKFILKFGFFYLGYRPQYYYWEFIIMFRKILTIYVSLLPDSALSSKVVLIMLIVSVSFYLHLKSKPYAENSLNKLELNAISVSLATIFFGMFYVSKIDDVSQVIIFILIVFINVFFLANWLIIILFLSLKKFARSKKFEKIKAFFLSSSKL